MEHEMLKKILEIVTNANDALTIGVVVIIGLVFGSAVIILLKLVQMQNLLEDIKSGKIGGG